LYLYGDVFWKLVQGKLILHSIWWALWNSRDELGTWVGCWRCGFGEMMLQNGWRWRKPSWCLTWLH